MPCFTPGIATVTLKGERAVEELGVGDQVVTRDGGVREVRWIGRRSFSFGRIQADPHLKPVMIGKGSLGPDLPDSDMMLSPNTRILARRDRTALYFEEPQALVAAKHLLTSRSIRTVEVLGVTYLHFIFDRHEIVLANGVWTEAFHPADASLGAQGNAQRNEIFEIFPDLREGEAARRKEKVRARRESVLLDFSR